MGGVPTLGVDGLNPDDPGIRLLAGVLAERADAPTLLCYCGDLPGSAPTCTRLILDVRERAGARHTLVEPDDVPALAGRFQRAFVWPRAHLGLDFSKESLLTAAHCVEAGGEIWLAARKQKGLARLKETLAGLCTELETVARSKGYHLVRGVRAAAPVDPDPEAYLLEEEILGDRPLISAAGTFSRRGLDAGSRILLHFTEHKLVLPVADADVVRAIDIGAGVGPLAVYLLRRFPTAQVHAVETNLRALTCLRANLEHYGERAEILATDGLGPPTPAFAGTAHLVLSNPPTHAPPQVLARLLGDSLAWLAPGGKVLAVVSRPGRAAEALDAAGAQVHVYEVSNFFVVEAAVPA